MPNSFLTTSPARLMNQLVLVIGAAYANTGIPQVLLLQWSELHINDNAWNYSLYEAGLPSIHSLRRFLAG